MKQGKELNQNQWTAKYGLLNPSFCIQFCNREKKKPTPVYHNAVQILQPKINENH